MQRKINRSQSILFVFLEMRKTFPSSVTSKDLLKFASKLVDLYFLKRSKSPGRREHNNEEGLPSVIRVDLFYHAMPVDVAIRKWQWYVVSEEYQVMYSGYDSGIDPEDVVRRFSLV